MLYGSEIDDLLNRTHPVALSDHRKQKSPDRVSDEGNKKGVSSIGLESYA